MADPATNSAFDELMRLRPDGLSPNAWALKAGVSRTVWSDMRRHGNPSRRTLEKLLSAIDMTVAQFEAIRAGERGTVRTEVAGTGLSSEDVVDQWRGAGRAKPVPLVGSAIGGDWDELEAIELTELHLGDVLDYLARPAPLAQDPDAYAVTIVGDSMAPRFEPGERAFVSPRSPASIGDDVIVQLKNGQGEEADRVTMVLIKRLVKRTAKVVELRQFNPDRTFQVPIERVAAIHRVRGRL